MKTLLFYLDTPPPPFLKKKIPFFFKKIKKYWLRSEQIAVAMHRR